MTESIQQFFDKYPYLFFLIILSVPLLFLRFFGTWAQLAASYGYRSQFIGQTWRWQSLMISRTTYSGCVTLGVNATGFYIAPFILFRGGHSSVLIPWTELELVLATEDPDWGAVTILRPRARPQIKITLPQESIDAFEQAIGGKLPLQ